MSSSPQLSVRAAQLDELAGAEPVLESLHLADAALETLVELSGADEATLRCADGWCAQVSLDGTPLWVRGTQTHWSIFSPHGSDESEAALAARKLHGLL